MNFTDKQWEWIRWFAVVALVAVFGFLGLQPPTVPPTPSDLGVLATNQKITVNRGGDTMTFASGAGLIAAAGSTITFAGEFNPTVVKINGTPVIAFNTPQPTYAYTAPTVQVASNKYVVCGSNTITGTGTIAHGLATPQYITAGLAADATGDGVRVTWTNASATVTLKVWNSALTPAAAATPVAVDWCAVGTK